jgi:hypothetical protein
MIKNPSASANIPDGSILNIKIANGTISSAKLDASLNALINAGGGGGSVAEGSITSFHIATGSILGTDISHNTITYDNIAVNAVTNTKIADNSITHAKLSSNCVESHNIKDGTILGTDISGATITGSNIAVGTITSSNILDGTILGTDISFGQISLAHLDASFNTTLTDFGVALEEDGDAIKALSRPFGIIRIINESLAEDNIDYELYVYNAIDEEYDSIASAIRLKKAGSFTHFYQVANILTNMKLVVASTGGVDVLAFNIHQGAELVESDGNELIFCIGEGTTNYQNIEIGVEVEVII